MFCFVDSNLNFYFYFYFLREPYISAGLALGAECTALSVGSEIMTFSTMLRCSMYVARASRYWRSAAWTSDSETSSEEGSGAAGPE